MMRYGQNRPGMTLRLCMAAMGVTLNVAGAFLAMSLKLPIYLDSIGTMVVAALLGPVYGGIVGFTGGIMSGLTFDVYSFYYAPAQALTGLMAGWLFRTAWMQGKRLPFGALAAVLPCTLLSAVITSALFGGLTSSGSSLIVLILQKLGLPLVASVFGVQILTDYMDKFLAAALASAVLSSLAYDIKRKIWEG